MRPRHRPRHLAALVCLLAVVAISGPAAASIGVAGTGEPRFTNSSTNTIWFHWDKPPDPKYTNYYGQLTYFHGATGQIGTSGPTGATRTDGAGRRER